MRGIDTCQSVRVPGSSGAGLEPYRRGNQADTYDADENGKAGVDCAHEQQQRGTEGYDDPGGKYDRVRSNPDTPSPRFTRYAELAAASRESAVR
jgi:hypothetical protein